MSDKRDDGGPAFPTDTSNDSTYTNISGGMSLRDYFAAQAPLPQLAWVHAEMTRTRRSYNEVVAIEAYVYADAMIAERTK